MAMQDFDRDELERWLKEKPPAVAVAIAVRCALRILPTLELQLQGLGDKRRIAAKLILPAFRASTISSAAAVGPADEVMDSAAAAADARAGWWQRIVRDRSRRKRSRVRHVRRVVQ